MKLSENNIAHEDLRLPQEPKILFLIDRLHSTEGGAEGVVPSFAAPYPPMDSAAWSRRFGLEKA